MVGEHTSGHQSRQAAPDDDSMFPKIIRHWCLHGVFWGRSEALHYAAADFLELPIYSSLRVFGKLLRLPVINKGYYERLARS
jgi:hypothetical protein